MIYIITRTNKRPNKFALCAESVQNQTVECEHITISEDEVPRYAMGDNITNVALTKSDFEHYNQYLDWAFANIGEDDDYFAVLDDDDFYLWNDSLEYALNKGNNADLILWRVNSAVGVVPSIDAFNRKAVESSNISMIGFLIKKKAVKNARFGNRTLGDFRFLRTAVQENDNVKWVDAVLSSVNPMEKFGGGRESDISKQQVQQGYEQAKKHFKHFRKW